MFALADEGAERRRPDLTGAHVELGLGAGVVIEQHPATDVLPLKVTLRTHGCCQLCRPSINQSINRGFLEWPGY